MVNLLNRKDIVLVNLVIIVLFHCLAKLETNQKKKINEKKLSYVLSGPLAARTLRLGTQIE